MARRTMLMRTALLLLICSLASCQNNVGNTTAGNAVETVPPNTLTTVAAPENSSAAPPNNAPPPNNAAPTMNDASNTTTSSSATSNATAAPVRVDQTVPFFRGVRSCLPFNLLVAAPQKTGESSAMTINGRITIIADASVINSTSVAVEDGILSLSLNGTGFFSNQVINFTVTIPPSGGEFESIANHGSGMVVLGPGLNTSSLRVNAASVGQVRAINITTNILTFTGSGVLGSSLTGAFSEVFVNTGAATGTVALDSVTPMNVSVNLGGITTLLVDGPPGTTIMGRAAGLSKVQYTNATCTLLSQTASLLPRSSLFGPSGDIFGNKCTNVSAATMEASLGAANDPQWTCGVVVDGNLSCAGANVTERQEVPLVVLGEGGGAEGANAAPGTADGNFTTPPQNFVNSTAPNNAASNAAPSNAASNAGGGNNTANTAPANNAGATTNTGGNTANTATTTSGNTATNAGARRLFAGRRLRQFTFPSFPLMTTFTPSGLLATGTYTSGPGASASSSTSTTGAGGTTFQTSTSQGGSPPVTVTGGSGFYNPVVVPASNIASSPSPSPAPSSASSPAPSSSSQPSSVSISTGGEGASGIAVVNTQCAVNTSLSMLMTTEEAPAAAGGNEAVNTTTTSNAVSGTNAAPGNTAAGNSSSSTNNAATTTGNNAPANNIGTNSGSSNGPIVVPNQPAGGNTVNSTSGNAANTGA